MNMTMMIMMMMMMMMIPENQKAEITKIKINDFVYFGSYLF